jgi:hypothetical protein
VVEAWDRLGRLRPDRQTELIAELLRTGVSIGVCRLDDVFGEDDFGTHKWTTLATFVQLAYQESKQKAERVGKAWGEKKRRAREGKEVTTRRLPGWLRCDSDAGTIVPVPDRVAVVRRVFAESKTGRGVITIARGLNQDRVPVFGRTVYRGRPVVWDTTAVSGILKSRAVLGEYQPKRYNGGGRPTPDGEPIPGYFPAVIGAADFHAVQTGTLARTKGRVRGRRSKGVNLFSGMLRDARDGGNITYQPRPERFSATLIPATPKRRNELSWASFPARVFETAVLTELREVRAEDVFGRPRGGDRVDELRGKVAELDRLIALWTEKMNDPNLVGIVGKKLSEFAGERRQLTDELARVEVEAACPAAEAWGTARTLADVLRADPSEERRLALRAALRRTVEGLWCVFAGVGASADRMAAVTVGFAGGAVRNYFVFYRPSRGNGRGRKTSPLWAVRSVHHPDDRLPFNSWNLATGGDTGTDAKEVEAFIRSYPRDVFERVIRSGRPAV